MQPWNDGESRLDRVAPLWDPTQLPRVITWNQAPGLSVTRDALRHRVRSGDWRRVLPRTYLTSDTMLWRDRLDAALAFAGPGSMLSGAAGLTDLGLRTVRPEGSVLVLVPLSTTCRSTSWVRVRRTSRLPDPALLPGPRRAPVARAVADRALELRLLDDVRMLVGDVVRRNLCSVEELRTELDTGPRQHSAFFRLALLDVDAGAWSAPEARTARLLTAAGLGPFEQNARIDLADGTYRVVDFLWRALRAVLEIDSDTHHALAGDADATAARHLQLESAGFSVVHYRPALIARDSQAFTSAVASWLDSRRRPSTW